MYAGCIICEKHNEMQKVKLPILASIDNGRAVDIGNKLSLGTTCHVDVKQNFLWELKEAGIVELQ